MLKINRPQFKSGMMFIKDREPKLDESGKPTGEYKETKIEIKASDKNKPFEAKDEKYVLENNKFVERA